ncbi:heavy metal translocating P-type ATPase [Hyphomonas jannaschiana]|uniref:P-type Zn(2+) transporter n=1 Tax=Hyphomonas jannaschiana VP2 TaxID=1280952 RepID=A0A059FHY2_9PROT|nr:heavy metal translocating P-type ATPase [Hyphomonas jannaschiana]KCZ90265.1 ATPase P [Hyphomonas jannaschiana VP2]
MSEREQPTKTARARGGYSHDGVVHRLFGHQAELTFALVCGLALAVGWLCPKVGLMSDSTAFFFLLAAYLFGGYFALREAIAKIVSGVFQIDFLMIVAAVGAAALGEWAEGAFLLFLFAIGHALEQYAMTRAKESIAALGDLAPDVARVKCGDDIQEVALDAVNIGDIVVVRSNERIPTDGFVTNGTSVVNQAPITGESTPVNKRPVENFAATRAYPEKVSAEHHVFAGSINGSGSLEIEVSRLSTDTTLARVIEMVNSAETRQSPTQSFTRKFERIFVPLVIGLAIATSLSFLFLDETAADSFYRAMAVLVAASPCALAIATPSAVLSGVARAARGGVLIKGGAPLEALGRVKAVAFDKTGTLTEGTPKLVDIVSNEGSSEEELLSVAAAVESLSDHPLAEAVVRDASRRLGARVSPATEFSSLTGRGVSAVVDGKPVHIGKSDLFAEIPGVPIPADLDACSKDLVDRGRTTMIVRHGDRYLGVIGLMDTPRKAAKPVIARLRELGIKRMMMISGDNQRVADAVAGEIGLDEAFGNLMPEDKVVRIAEISKSGGVAMVGDGVNDAPALANATVGITMGAAGSDVALETADVALMADDLERLPFAVGLSRSTSRIIRQNLFVSLGVVGLLIPATLLGLGIGPAVAVHEGSTLAVVANALRLLGYDTSLQSNLSR